jgi:hypothetical protein
VGGPAVLAALARILPRGQFGQLRVIISPRTLLRWVTRIMASRPGRDWAGRDLAGPVRRCYSRRQHMGRDSLRPRKCLRWDRADVCHP